MRYSLSTAGPPYIKTTAVVMSELLKIVGEASRRCMFASVSRASVSVCGTHDIVVGLEVLFFM
jgi:hypothetical protein